LKSHGIDYIGPIAQLPGLLGIYFYDPNGIRLEFACQPEDGEAPAVIPCVIQTKAEARDELATLPGVTPEWIESVLPRCPGGRSGYSAIVMAAGWSEAIACLMIRNVFTARSPSG